MSVVSTPGKISYEYKTADGIWHDGTYSWTNRTFDMASINHYPLNTDGDDGGPFFLVKTWDLPGFAYGVHRSYRGLVSCHYTTQTPKTLAGYADPTDLQVYSNGTTGIARSIPTNPAFDAATFIGELRNDGIPALIANASSLRDRSQIARNAGSNYLNQEFGWQPLIDDVRKLARAVKHSDETLRSYQKAGTIKTRVGYDGSTDLENDAFSGSVSSRPTQANVSGLGHCSQYRKRRWWFRGAFKYHIPVPDTYNGKIQNWLAMSDHLLGWQVTPETLWNISPWTWAVDWFTNTGDVLANISAIGQDGLALQYGYSMAETVREWHAVTTFNGFDNGPITVSRTNGRKYCRRMAATPYGFGTNLNTLSSKQIAIIAALGLSRS